MKMAFSVALALVLGLETGSFASPPKPKYGPIASPRAVPLSQSNEYFRNPKHPAPAFWALISFYIPQSTPASCSSATLAMVLNAARAEKSKTADDAVVQEKALWNKANVDHWKERLNGGYFGQYGADLELAAKVADAAFKSYGFKNVTEKVVHVSQVTPVVKKELIQDLRSLSGHTFIMANFNQQSFTADADVGHFAPIAAYDEDKGRVLVLDPDREYYEPYWISVDTFLEGMNTLDSSKKKHRGYIVVKSEEK